MLHITIMFVHLFLAGLLAGEEFVIYYGVRVPLRVLDEQPQIQLRQALVRKLRVLVPAIYMPTLLLGIAVTVMNDSPGLRFQCAGVLALLIWILITLFGTVPINKGMLVWRPDAPPSHWSALIRRWERIDTFRTWAALLAFACFLTAVAIQLNVN